MKMEGRSVKVKELCQKLWGSSAMRDNSDAIAMKDKLEFLIQKCEDIREERDDLVIQYKRTMADSDAIRHEIRYLKDNCKDVSALEEQLKVTRLECENIGKRRDSLRLRARRSEASCDAMRKVTEEHKVEAQELKAQLKEFGLLKNKLNTVRQEYENMMKERNVYMQKAQTKTESKEAIKVERDALKVEVENLKAKIKHGDQLDKQLHTTELNFENFKRERDLLKSRIRWMGTDRDTMLKDTEALKDETEVLRARCSRIPVLEKELNTERRQCENMTKARKGLILKERRSAAQKEAVRQEWDNLKLESEKPRGRCKNCAALEKELNARSKECKEVEKERRSLLLSLHRKGEDTDAMTKERDGLKHAAENHRAQPDGAAAEEHANASRKGSNFLKLETL
jgi:chromosome segregation ATPase